jgi:hypothetical protein
MQQFFYQFLQKAVEPLQLVLRLQVEQFEALILVVLYILRPLSLLHLVLFEFLFFVLFLKGGKGRKDE